jgi:hypothetical protein
MQLLGSAPVSHLCDQKRRSKVTGLSDLMTLFIDLGCLYCKQTQRAFNVFKSTLNWLKIDSVDQKFNWLECGNFSQDSGMPGTEGVIAFSQLAVKGLSNRCLTTFIFSVSVSNKCSVSSFPHIVMDRDCDNRLDCNLDFFIIYAIDVWQYQSDSLSTSSHGHQRPSLYLFDL